MLETHHNATLPLISVVIPVYNGANYLAEAVDSALAQSWPNTEVIVVDDGSDDAGATARICARYGNRIRYFYKVNGGVATAINYGIQVMRGEFFAWLSHDDAYTSDHLVTLFDAYRAIKTTGTLRKYLVVFSGVEVVDMQGAPLRRNLPHYPRGRAGVSAVTRSSINGCSLLIPHACFREAGLLHPGLPTTQDSDMWQRLLRIAHFEHVSHVSVRSRHHPDQETHSPWHWLESNLNKLSIFDRLAYGEIEHSGISLTEHLQRLDRTTGGFRGRPGVQANIRDRIDGAVRSQSVAIVHPHKQKFSAWKRFRKLRWKSGRVKVIRQARPKPRSILKACARLDNDLVWLLDGSMKVSTKTLERMIDCLARHPQATACLHPDAAGSKSVLGPFHGALLSLAAVRQVPDGQDRNWAALAHILMRNGGFCRYDPVQYEGGMANAAATELGGASKAEAAFGDSTAANMPLARVNRLTWFRTFRACGPQAGLRLKELKHRLATEAQHRIMARRNGRGLNKPAIMNLVVAYLARRRTTAVTLNRMIWRVSSTHETGRLRLLRWYGLSGHFDQRWYAQAYPEACAGYEDPLLHYLDRGRFEGLDPSPGFDALAYLSEYPEVARKGWNPLQHYALWGRLEGRRTRRSSHLEELENPRNDASRTILLVYHRDCFEAGRLANRLAVQLARLADTRLLGLASDASCHLHQVQGKDNQAGEPFSLDELSFHIKPETLCRTLVISSGRAFPPSLAETISRPWDILHTGGAIPHLPQEGPQEGNLQVNACHHYTLSSDTARDLTQRFGEARVTHVSQPDPGHLGRIRPWLRHRGAGESRRIALFGRLSRDDGLGPVLRVLSRVDAQNLPFVFKLYGSHDTHLPAWAAARLEVVSPESERDLNDAVCAFNPHVAWIPLTTPARATLPLAEAAMLALPIVAVDTPDARAYLAGRPLVSLLPKISADRSWLYALEAILSRRTLDQWRPYYPLEGFQVRDNALRDALHQRSTARSR